MEKKINQMQQEYERLQQRQNELIEKFNATGYVVAGYGGNTYYCFVGAGRGFNGAALVPMSRRPFIFSTKQDARREATKGIYRNGRNEIISLKVENAGTYFRNIHAMNERILQTFKELF